MVDIGHGRGWLSDAAAASLWRVDARIGHPLDVNEAGRTWAQQNEFYQTYLRDGWPIALSPNAPSIHQLGNALDTDERITAILNDHGWFHTVYRNGVLVEPWHYEYQSSRDNHINEGIVDVNAEENNAVMSTWQAMFLGGGEAGDQSVIARLVEIQQNLRAIAPRVTNLDQQVTGADDFDAKTGPSVAGRLISVDGKIDALVARPAAAVSPEQVLEIARAIVKAINGQSGLDPEAIASIVEDGVKAAMKDISFKTEIATTDAE